MRRLNGSPVLSTGVRAACACSAAGAGAGAGVRVRASLSRPRAGAASAAATAPAFLHHDGDKDARQSRLSCRRASARLYSSSSSSSSPSSRPDGTDASAGAGAGANPPSSPESCPPAAPPPHLQPSPTPEQEPESKAQSHPQQLPRKRIEGRRARLASGRHSHFPPLHLPHLFLNECVVLPEDSRTPRWKRAWRNIPERALPYLPDDVRQRVQAFHERRLDHWAWTPAFVREASRILSRDRKGQTHQGMLAAIDSFSSHASALIVALAYQPHVGEDHAGHGKDDTPSAAQPAVETVDPSRRHLPPPPGVDAAGVFSELQQFRCCKEAVAVRGLMAAVGRSVLETAVFRGKSSVLRSDALADALLAEFGLAAAPGRQPAGRRRPVPVLALTGYSGVMAARLVIDRFAAQADSDVVHVDAATLGEIIGGYLGQDCHARRGRFSMLGYRVAEINGRLAPRAPSALAAETAGAVGGEDAGGDSSSRDTSLAADDERFPAAVLKAALLGKRGLAVLAGPGSRAGDGQLPDLDDPQSPAARAAEDDRWEELKLAHALEQLADAAQRKRALIPASEADPPPSRRRTIIHLQDFVELSELDEGALIIAKLRTAADRLTETGEHDVVLVGSSSRVNDSSARPWLSQIARLSELDCHFFPHSLARALDTTSTVQLIAMSDMSAIERTHTNIANIGTMLDAMMGTLRSAEGPISVASASEMETVTTLLGRHVYDLDWVYSVASAMVARRLPPHGTYRLEDLVLALAKQPPEAGVWGNNVSWNRGSFSWSLPVPARPNSPAPLPPSPPWALLSRVRDQNFIKSVGVAIVEAAAEVENKDKLRQMAEDGREPKTKSQGHSKKDLTERQRKLAAVIRSCNEHEKMLASGIIDTEAVKTTWDEVVCDDGTKESLMSLTSLTLERPDAFSYGVLAKERIQGCLLYGPPGTGKTLMARALAKQASATMLEVSGASLNNKYVGESEKSVRAVFSLARKLAPAVVFIDEADSLLARREARRHGATSRDIINQFLREWDGVIDTKTFVMIATNRPFDLDEAVLRRLPRKVLVDLPLRADRLAILRVLLRDETLQHDDADASSTGLVSATPSSTLLDTLASKTELYSGSDLKSLCVQAAMEAVKDEIKARDASPDPGAHQFPSRRVLLRDHFDRALREISASISGDAESIKNLRTFDQLYGSARARHGANAKGVGFGIASGVLRPRSENVRIRQELHAA